LRSHYKFNGNILYGDIKVTFTPNMDGLTSSIKVTSSFDYTLHSVEALYTCVFQNKALENIFLGYEWISTWLKCALITPELITFTLPCGNQPIGFAFIGCIESSLGKTFLLNQTGNQQDDQIWIEYNDVICASHHQACRDALLSYLANKHKAFKFIGINNIEPWDHKQWREWSLEPSNGYSAASRQASATESEGSLVAHFSKNTKSQISRSKRFIAQHYGELTLRWLSPEQIEAALKEMGSLHIKQWGKHDFGSGFSNTRFVDFHRQLMQKGMQENDANTRAARVHLAKFTAGELTIGYLYFFTLKNKVYFYLSAINYASQDNKYKPGLLMHKLAMQHFDGLGYSSYDFLAGDARYKTSLSNEKYLLHSMQLYVNKWYYLPLKLAVNIKRWCTKMLKNDKAEK
jgi:CelD/BcsL family acetyltransferase involved in cellulose biosynthesis